MTGPPKRWRRKSWIAAMIAFLVLGSAGLWAWGSLRHRESGLVVEGQSAYDRRDWDQSASLARQRLKEAPQDPSALRLAARTAARQDRDQAAIATYARLELKIMTAEDYFLLGRALSRTGQDDQALKTLELAKAADPDRLETLDELAQVYFRKDLPAAAEAIAERLIREPGWEVRGQLLMGTCLAARNDPAGSARALQRAFQLDPAGKAAAPQPVEPLRMLLVRSWLKSGQPSEARSGPRDDSRFRIRPRIRLAPEPMLPPGGRLGTGHRGPRALPEPTGAIGRSTPSRPPMSARRSVPRAMPRSHVRSSRAITPRRSPAPPIPARSPCPIDRWPIRPIRRFRIPSGPEKTASRSKRKSATRFIGRVARYAFGSPDRYVTLVGPDDRGVARMLRISSYHSPKGSGVDITSGVPPHPSDPSNYLGNALIPGDGERRCLNCHTTNFHSVEFKVGPESNRPLHRLRRMPRPRRQPRPGAEAGIRGPGDRRPQKLDGPDGQRRLRTLPWDRPRRERHRRGGRPRLAPLPVDRDVSQPMLYRERQCPSLRHLPRPAQERRDLAGLLRIEMPGLPRLRQDPLPGQCRQRLHRVPHAADLGAADPRLQVGPQYPGPCEAVMTRCGIRRSPVISWPGRPA